MTQLLWTQKQDIGPTARTQFDMVFDSARQRVVLFGGFSGTINTGTTTAQNDTWEWNGSEWTQTADIGPSPRQGHALAYDSQRQRVVLFGGKFADANLNTVLLGDTWEWDGENWTQVADTGPSPRFDHAMTFDSLRQRVILFGGRTGEGSAALADTWVWNGNEWAQEQDSGPSARFGHKLVYDSVRDRVVLFGGNMTTVTSIIVHVPGPWWNPGAGSDETEYITKSTPLNDTWEYDGTVWAHMADTGPEPRSGYGMAFDGEQVLLFGGSSLPFDGSSSAKLFGSTWSWNGKFWTQRQDMGPGGRSLFGMAYDSIRQRSVLFGGNTGGTSAVSDTWELYNRPTLPVEPA